MPDDYRISDLSTAPSIGNSDLMELSVVNAASESGYTSMKAPVLNLANKIVNETQYASDLQTQNKTITGAINELAQGGGGGGSDADIVKTASGNPCSFSTSFAGALKSLTAEIVASGGNGTPSNPIPIVGHTELNLTRCGKNLFNASEDNITEGSNICTISGNVITNTGANAYDAIRFEQPLKEGNYVLHASNISTNGIIQVSYYDGSYQDLGYLLSNNTTLQFTVPTVATKVRISLYSSQAGGMSVEDLQCELGSTPSAYEPYNGQTFTVAFGQTVYGGLYDKSGRLTITWVGADISNLDWQRLTDGAIPYFRHTFTDSTLTQLVRNFKCSNYPNVPFADIYSSGQDKAAASYAGGVLIISDNDYSDATSFKNGNVGTMIAYELATPIVIDVDAISVFAEKGVNDIISDGGGDVDVEYYTDLAEDIKDFIGDGVEVGDLANVEITTPSNNQVLKYDATSQKWVNGTGGGGASDLDDLGDVEITTPSNDQVLKYDSASQKWVNGNASSGSAHNYSTTEQVVGTWVDGSPVYEKTVYSAGGVTGNFDIPHNVSNIDRVISYSGTVKDTDFSTYHDIWSIPRLDNIAVGIDRFTTTVIKVVNPSEFNNRLVDWYITFRYTKST